MWDLGTLASYCNSLLKEKTWRSQSEIVMMERVLVANSTFL